MTSIRPLVRADEAQLQPLVDESVAEGFEFLARFATELRAGLHTLDESREIFLGVVQGDRLVAIGGVTPDPYVDSADVGRIRHVYVASQVRRQGIGRQLLAAIEMRASATFATLRLRTDTASAAHFYEALGYRPTLDADATHIRECTRNTRT